MAKALTTNGRNFSGCKTGGNADVKVLWVNLYFDALLGVLVQNDDMADYLYLLLDSIRLG